MITIKIEDLGFSDYKIRSDTNILGKQYDSNAESIFVEKPETEADSVCTMVVSYGNKIIDQIVVSDEQIWITSAISQFDHVKIQFVFQNLAEEYEKKSESKLFDFLPAKKPTDFVAETSTQQTTYASIVTKSFVDCESESGTLTFKNLSGEVVDEVDVVSTADFEALQQQVKTNTENISANSDVISDETEARTTADTTLQSNIDKKVSKYVTSNNIETTIDNGEMASEILLDALDNNKEKEGTVTVGGDQIALQVFDIGSATYPASVVLSDSGVNIAGDVYVNNEKVATQTQLNTEISDRQDADAALQTNIDAEAETRASADETLQSNIDALSKSIASDLENYYIKSETYSQEEINSKISAIPKYATEVVDALPTEDVSESTVYLVVSGDESNNLYTEYIYVGGSWEKLGTQALDLSGYATTSSLNDLKSQVETNTENIATNTADISTNASAIVTETTERKSADETLQSNIDSETSARTSADSTLQSNIDSETSARTSADSTLQSNIDSETSARTSADSTLQTNIDNEASTRATADSTLQTNIDNLELASGASLALSIDSNSYVMTLNLLNSEGTVLSTGRVDLPLETMVVNAFYSNGKLYLTTQNGTTLDGIDISSIISGLVSQTDFDTLSTQVDTNATNIATNTTNISTNTSDISDLKTQVETNKTNIELLTQGVDLAAMQTQLDTNTSAISESAGKIVTDADTGYVGEIFNDYENNVASGLYSHAEGRFTTASGLSAHAENGGTASGAWSHAEGGGTASGSSSHAEGSAYARDSSSHAEGQNTYADGQASHSEGWGSIASGIASHAGGYYTHADQEYQTAIGKCNLEGQTGSLFVVGNGDDADTRSNAFEVFQDGHAEVSGDLQVSGNLTDGVNSIAVESIADTSNVVHTTGDEEIGGEKKFTTEVVKEHAKGYSGFAVRNTGYTMGTQPDSTIGLGRYIFLDSEGNWFAYLQSTTQASHTNLTLSCRLTTDSTTRATVELRDDGSSPKIFACGALSPTSTSKYDLGSSSYKWKDLYLSNSILLNGGTITYDASTDTFTI